MGVENLNGFGNAVSVPQVVRAASGKAQELSSILADFPYAKLSTGDRNSTGVVRRKVAP